MWLSSLLQQLLFGLFFLAAFNANAADYVWEARFGGFTRTGASPSAACSAAMSAYNSSKPASHVPVTLMRLIKQTEQSFTCMWGQNGSEIDGIAANRSGDSCPPGTEYDSATGQCKEPPNDCEVGDLFPARGADSPIITGGDGSKIVASQPPTGVCYNSCSYSGVQGETRSSGCYISGADESMGYCNYVIKGTGESCSAENYQLAQSGSPLNPPPDPDEPPPTLCPPGWGVSGTTCYKLPPKDPTDPTDPANPGGGDDGSGGGGGGGGGNDGGGDGDSGGDGGSGGGDGDGSGGDGNEPPTNGGGTDENGNSADHSNDCKIAPTCDGDVFQCSILNQSWSNRCAMLAGPTEADLKNIADQKAKAIADQEAIQGEFDSDVAGLMNEFNNGVGSGSRQGSCLPDEEFTVMGKRFVLPISQACPYLALLRYAVIAMAYLGAARIVSRAI